MTRSGDQPIVALSQRSNASLPAHASKYVVCTPLRRKSRVWLERQSPLCVGQTKNTEGRVKRRY